MIKFRKKICSGTCYNFLRMFKPLVHIYFALCSKMLTTAFSGIFLYKAFRKSGHGTRTEKVVLVK